MFRTLGPMAFLCVAMSLVGCKTKTAPPTTPAAPAAPSPLVKAGDVLAAYGGNALAADAKYKDKVLRVSGKFSSVQKAPLMGYVLQLLPEDAGDINASYIQCFLEEAANAEVAKLATGAKIVIEGKCDGQVLGQVKFSKCLLSK